MWRKGFCFLLELLILLRLGINTMPLITEYSNDNENGMSTLAKGTYFIFLSFYIVVFYLYWTTAKYFCEMFNHTLSLSEKICLKERSPRRIQLVKWSVNASWIFVTFYIFLTILVHGLKYLKVNTSNHFNFSHGVSNSSKILRYKVDFTDIHYHHEFILVEITFAAIGCMNIGYGMMSFWFLGVLAIFFRQLILLFYWKIEAMDELGLRFLVPHEVRTFNKIGKIIDTFNQHYGLMILVGAAVVVTYISTSVEQAFSGLQNILRPSTGLHLLLSYLPTLASAFMIAEVSRVAGTFGGIIKDQFGKFTKECGDPAESLCGISIVHFDLATSNIGFKGLGFFTVSYQFITTILSLIVTYSIVIVQMFPHDVSQTNDLVN
ncbi:unnamed protein product [Orchesella dallaii]|uniref:Gustatory receptor n=1 Tax=Orchesella dallaii TaxID=48710 RepID=A0ABP1Q4B1_9HEXA